MTTGHPYMRRRVRPARVGTPAVPASGAASPAVPRLQSASLSLATPSAPAPAPAPGPRVDASGAAGPSERVIQRRAARAARIVPFPAPDARDVHLLGTDDAVARIDRRRSAVGTLQVSGCTSLVSETTDRLVGASTADGDTAGRQVTTAGNRPLVGFDRGRALVALRHVRQLRRALFIDRGTDRMIVTLQDGTTLAVDPGIPDTMTILALSVIDGVIELRAEPFPRHHHDGEVFAAFGFSLSAPSTGA